MNQLNPSIKHHTFIGLLLFVWGFLFSFFTRPFEHGEMDLKKWIYVSIGFSLFAGLAYILVVLGQNYIYTKRKKWNIGLEIAVYLTFYLIYATITFFYYKSPLINGPYSLSNFLSIIILNTALVISPIIFIARRYSLSFIPQAESLITIKGENKLDVLKLKKDELVCVSNAQNYVEVFYLENDQLKTKLIRSSLKNIQRDFDFLVQIHRSHLINPAHFKSWKDSKTINLSHMDLPVSKNYKKDLMALS